MIYKIHKNKIVKSYRFIKNAARHNDLSVFGVSAYCRGLMKPDDNHEQWMNTDYGKEDIFTIQELIRRN